MAASITRIARKRKWRKISRFRRRALIAAQRSAGGERRRRCERNGRWQKHHAWRRLRAKMAAENIVAIRFVVMAKMTAKTSASARSWPHGAMKSY
jgi:hypothetical protein